MCWSIWCIGAGPECSTGVLGPFRGDLVASSCSSRLRFLPGLCVVGVGVCSLWMLQVYDRPGDDGVGVYGRGGNSLVGVVW